MTDQVQTRHPHTDADVESVARAEFEHDMREAACPDTWDETFPFVRDGYRNRARAGLDALAAAGQLAGTRPTPHLDAVKAERDKLRDANDTLALTLAEAIGTLGPNPEGRYETTGWIPASRVDRWRRALNEAEEARSEARP